MESPLTFAILSFMIMSCDTVIGMSSENETNSGPGGLVYSSPAGGESRSPIATGAAVYSSLRIGIIYKVTNLINGKVYVGKSLNSFKKRMGQHKGVYENLKNKKADTVFYKALRKYGWDNFLWEQIDFNIIPEILAELEKKYIVQFNCKAPHGYNLTDGGEGICGLKRSQETKNKIGNAHRGKKMSEISIQKMIAARSNISQEWRDNIRAGQLGKKLSEEHKSKIGLAGIGRVTSNETKIKLRLARLKTIEAKRNIYNWGTQ